MYVIKLENTVTHQIHRFESEDMNNGSKLYYEFNVNTLELEDGEYILTLCDSEDNVLSEDILRIGDFTPQTLQYKAGGDTYISIEFDAKIGPKKAVLEGPTAVIEPDEGYDGFTYVEIDANALVDNAKNEGYEEGIEYQKTQLTTIDITENGVYTNDNGYGEVIVNVPDLNGSYDEGYEQGYGDGYTEGETVSYESGYEDGYVAANEEVAETARVLEITENGLYCSEYSKEGEDYIFDEPITGDGDFYDYIEITDIGFNTGIIPTEYTKVELWVKPSSNKREQDTIIFGSQNGFSDKGIFKIRTNNSTPVVYDAEWNGKHMTFDMEDNVWHHIILGKEYGLIIDGEVLYEPWDDAWNETVAPITINVLDAKFTLYKGANGCYGMIKIDDTVFIPSELGYINTTTNEVLGTVSNGSYKYFNIEKPICEGNLIRTVKVNIVPKINLHKEGIKLSYSNFKQVPDCFDFAGITTLENMFSNCANLITAPNLDTSEVTNISRTFYYCGQLVEVPSYDLSNATNMSSAFEYCSKLTDLSFMENWVYPKNVDMASMFANIYGLTKCPALYIEGNTSYYQSYPFWSYSNLTSFTDFGGFIGLKYSMDKEYQLSKCLILSYESCINILNGLYDFVGNGETPNSSQGKLKVHQNFLDAVGDEITIGTNKGWTITA